ncbi:MAG: acyl-CoA dehydrogenase [Myxococcales bacterium]|nr:acyl-CoA dehydrogenase [Myxococcales bacterium]
MNILAYQLTAPLARGPYADLAAWLRQLPKCPFTGHVERALWGGFHADRLGYAFVAGYAAALSRLLEHVTRLNPTTGGRPFTERPWPAKLSLCATEAGGGHPRAIATRLDKQGGALVLNGEKTFATLAPLADELLVVASRGIEADGKNRLRIVRVKPTATGVTMTPRPETPFTPEIPHAVVRFTNAVVENEDVLPGDGYEQWLKPFRTIEDTHVLAATVGYLQGAARTHGFGHEVMAELVSTSLSLIDVGARDPDAPLTHIVLAGVFEGTRRLTASLDGAWEKAGAAAAQERARWERDRAILQVADVVRGKRTEAAWGRLSTPV